ncbi:MAG: hypothetical protein IPI83_06110 [Sphingomonadales bacterium]|nr:hypothetical protein [Sphingomonadales bacterium]
MRAGTAAHEAEMLKAEAFEAAQDMETSIAALTMAQTAARTAAGTGPLTELVRQQQDLSATGRELDHRLLSALASGNQPEADRLRIEIQQRAKPAICRRWGTAPPIPGLCRTRPAARPVRGGYPQPACQR